VRGKSGGLAAAVLCAALASAARARGESVVQVPVAGLLDGRPVSTLTGGAVVPWTTGLDKDDAFMTMAAAASLHQTGPALPDEGLFPANAEHPEVRLHVSNVAAPTSPQAHLVTAVGSFAFVVPTATYATIFLFLTGSYGDAPLAVKLTYADQTTTTTTFTLPDWGTGAALPKGPPRFFNLIAGLHKWNKAGASLDTPSHTITGVALTPSPDRALTTVEITKTTAAPWLTFWGATGLATSAPEGGADAGDASVARDASLVRDAPVFERPPATEDGASDAASEVFDAALEIVDAGSAPAAGTGADAAGASTDGASSLPSRAAGAAPIPRASGGCAVAERPHSATVALVLVALVLGWPGRGRRRRLAATSRAAGSRRPWPSSSPSRRASRSRRAGLRLFASARRPSHLRGCHRR
jgi:hypothetical protein